MTDADAGDDFGLAGGEVFGLDFARFDGAIDMDALGDGEGAAVAVFALAGVGALVGAA